MNVYCIIVIISTGVKLIIYLFVLIYCCFMYFNPTNKCKKGSFFHVIACCYSLIFVDSVRDYFVVCGD